MYYNGLSMREIAKLKNVSYSTINFFIRDNKIKARNKSEAHINYLNKKRGV